MGTHTAGQHGNTSPGSRPRPTLSALLAVAALAWGGMAWAQATAMSFR